MGMGRADYYSNPPWPGPKDLKSSFSWHWFGPTGPAALRYTRVAEKLIYLRNIEFFSLEKIQNETEKSKTNQGKT